jgi:uncharacterized SAM-binding protein YcdF (DUF218 family)
MSRPGRRWLAAFVAVGGFICLYLVRGSVLPLAARWLDVGQKPHRADCAFVLGGDAEIRPFVAAALFRVGFVRKVMVSQTVAHPAVEAGLLPPDHELTTRILVHRGVPPQDIERLGRGNRSTDDEAVALSETLRASPPEVQVLVVTSFFHTRRARWAFSRVLGPQMSQVSFVSCPMDGFQADNWWRSAQGFTMILGENLKLAYYFLRYDRTFYYIAAFVLVLAVGYVVRNRRGASGAATAAGG